MKARIRIAESTVEKLASKHRVTREEVSQCFCNREGRFLKDDREDHQTDPPTLWFIAETNQRRKLKLCFVITRTDAETYVELKTAYEPNADEIEIYNRHGS